MTDLVDNSDYLDRELDASPEVGTSNSQLPVTKDGNENESKNLVVIVKAASQCMDDITVTCQPSWTVKELKVYLFLSSLVTSNKLS